MSELMQKYLDIAVQYTDTNKEVIFSSAEYGLFSTKRPYRIFVNKDDGTEVVIADYATIIPVNWLITLPVKYKIQEVEEEADGSNKLY